jgi:hypothetical protein
LLPTPVMRCQFVPTAHGPAHSFRPGSQVSLRGTLISVHFWYMPSGVQVGPARGFGSCREWVPADRCLNLGQVLWR